MANVAGSLQIPTPAPPRGNRPFDVLKIRSRLPRPLSFVLAGGGAHGSVQWGCLQAIYETDLRPDTLIGTSVGALTAAVIAEDPVAAPTRLGYIWNEIDLGNLVGDSWLAILAAATKRQSSLTDSSAALAAMSSSVAARNFDQLRIPMTAVATDLATGDAVPLDSGELLPALMASSAIPGLMPPVTINDRRLVDGLASANLPAALAVDRGAKALIVFDTGSRPSTAPSTSTVRVVTRVNSILNANQRRGQLAYAAAKVPVILLPTPTELAAALDFRATATAAAHAYELARDFLFDLHESYPHLRLRPGLYARCDDPLIAEQDLSEHCHLVPRRGES